MSFAKDKLQSVQEFLAMENALNGFHLPLSAEAHQELQQLQTLMHSVELNLDSSDTWTYNSVKGIFKPSIIYKLNFQHIDNHQPSCWLWKSKCTSKHKFFAWLILHDRINTKDMLLRRNWKVTDNHTCVLCTSASNEDWRHLFFNCQFSTRIWNYLQISWLPGTNYEVLRRAKQSFNGPCFSEVVIIACWSIWKQRNGLIFKAIKPTFRGWKTCFVHQVTLLKYRVKDSIADSLSLWLDSLV
jgi:hypothetical protein